MTSAICTVLRENWRSQLTGVNRRPRSHWSLGRLDPLKPCRPKREADEADALSDAVYLAAALSGLTEARYKATSRICSGVRRAATGFIRWA